MTSLQSSAPQSQTFDLSFSPYAAEAAALLWDTGAIAFRPETPFRLTSGLLSPTYVDCRRLIAFPKARAKLMDWLEDGLFNDATPKADTLAIAGGETAGIPYAAFLAERRALPMVYVRKKPKGFGRNARIEGHLPEGQRVILVEDLATDGGSKIAFAEALRESGAYLDQIGVIFCYARSQTLLARLAHAQLRLFALASWEHVLAAGEAHIGEKDISLLRRFLANPQSWSDAQAA